MVWQLMNDSFSCHIEIIFFSIVDVIFRRITVLHIYNYIVWNDLGLTFAPIKLLVNQQAFTKFEIHCELSNKIRFSWTTVIPGYFFSPW